MKWLKRCAVQSHYTLNDICHGEATVSPHPPKFDPKDRRAKYRRMAKGLE